MRIRQIVFAAADLQRSSDLIARLFALDKIGRAHV